MKRFIDGTHRCEHCGIRFGVVNVRNGKEYCPHCNGSFDDSMKPLVVIVFLLMIGISTALIWSLL